MDQNDLGHHASLLTGRPWFLALSSIYSGCKLSVEWLKGGQNSSRFIDCDLPGLFINTVEPAGIASGAFWTVLGAVRPSLATSMASVI